MADLDIRILSLDSSEDLTFARINEFEPTDAVNITDYLLVSGYREEEGEEVTRRISIAKVVEEASRYLIPAEYMKWFIPVVSNQEIHWELHSIDEVGNVEDDTAALHPIHHIDLVEAIGEATSEKSGLITPADKVKLDNLNKATQSSDGLMPKEDKTKLDGLENYELPVASTSVLGGVKVDNSTIVINSEGVIKSNAGVPEATRVVIPMTGWNTQTHIYKAEFTVNTNNRNIIDVDPSSMDDWVNNRVYAIAEYADGIEFYCQTIPEHDIVLYVISMYVAYANS